MRYAILVARLHGQTTLHASKTGEPGKLNAEFKRLLAEPPPDLAELHLLVSDQGVTKRKKFAAPLQNSTPPQPAAVADETRDNSAAAASPEEVPSSPEPLADAPAAPESEPPAADEVDPQPKSKARR